MGPDGNPAENLCLGITAQWHRGETFCRLVSSSMHDNLSLSKVDLLLKLEQSSWFDAV